MMPIIKEVIEIFIAISIVLATLVGGYLRIKGLLSKVNTLITEDQVKQIIIKEIELLKLVNAEKFSNMTQQLDDIKIQVSKTQDIMSKITFEMIEK